jgi:hypothetical protein
MSFPSIKSIEAITTRENAKLIREYMEKRSYREHPSYLSWRAQFYHAPKVYEAVLHFAGLLLETHGTESFETRKGDYVDYCNAGDTYAPTLMYHGGRCRYLVGDWGTIAEREG